MDKAPFMVKKKKKRKILGKAYSEILLGAFCGLGIVLKSHNIHVYQNT